MCEIFINVWKIEQKNGKKNTSSFTILNLYFNAFEAHKSQNSSFCCILV